MEETKVVDIELDDDCDGDCDCGHEVPTAEVLAVMMTGRIDTSNIEECQYDKDEFQAGLNEYSRLAGKFTALMNVGLTPELALGYLVNMETAIMTKEMNIEMAKHGAIAKDKQEM